MRNGVSALHVSTLWLIIIATLAGATVLWFVSARWGKKGRILPLIFLLVAGAGSAWLSLRYPLYAWPIFVAALIGAGVLGLLFRKLGTNLRPSTVAWSQYLKGQGALLFFFLFIGIGSAWLSVTYGPYPGRVSKGGQLHQFGPLDPSTHPVDQEIDVENYSQISVFTTTKSPENGSAIVTIYLDHGEGGKFEIGQLDSAAKSWSRWDQANAGKHMSLVASAPTRPGAIPATELEIVVYLSPK